MRILLALMVLPLASCSKGGGSSSTAASSSVTGIDLSGTYVVQKVQCYNLALTTVTNTATYTGSYSSILTISGNSFTGSQISSTGICSVTTSGTIVANSSTVLNISESIVSASGGSCIDAETLNGVITPTTVSATFTTGQFVGSKTVTYFVNGSTLGLYSIYTDSNGDQCFEILMRQ